MCNAILCMLYWVELLWGPFVPCLTLVCIMSTASENTHPALALLTRATHALHPQIAIATYKIIKNQADTAVVGHANTAWTTQTTIMAILTEAFTSAANSNNITKWEPVLAALTNVSGGKQNCWCADLLLCTCWVT